MTHKSAFYRVVAAAFALALAFAGSNASAQTDPCSFGAPGALPFTHTQNHNGLATDWIQGFGDTGGDLFYEFNVAVPTAVHMTVIATSPTAVIGGVINSCTVAGASLEGAVSGPTGTMNGRVGLETAGDYSFMWGPRSSANNNQDITGAIQALTSAGAHASPAAALNIPAPGDGNMYNFSDTSNADGEVISPVDTDAFAFSPDGTPLFYRLAPVNGTTGDFDITVTLASPSGNSDTAFWVYEGEPAALAAVLGPGDTELVHFEDSLVAGGESATVSLTSGTVYTLIASGFNYFNGFGDLTVTVTSANAASVADWNLVD